MAGMAGMTSPTVAASTRPTPEAAATRNSPSVTGTESVLGSRPVRVEDHDDPPGRHIEVHLAVGPGHRPLSVARAVRDAMAGAATTDTPGPVTVTTAVLITETAAWRAAPPVTAMSAPR
ncbi:hypothetical protein [Streptomyces sviceus]|uniref:hypothetical protein n=1 Tax=Streptomyces sviceus TaxID=285530 RepID=UPI0036E483A9